MLIRSGTSPHLAEVLVSVWVVLLRDAREQLQVLVFGDDKIVSRCPGVCRDRVEPGNYYLATNSILCNFICLPQGGIGLDVNHLAQVKGALA